MSDLFSAKTSDDVIDCLKRGEYIESRRLGKTPFMYHCSVNNIEVVDQLIKEKCSVRASDTFGKGFDYACKNGHTKIVLLMLNIYGYDRPYLTKSCNFPLGFACENGYCDIFDILIEYGEDPNGQADILGNTPLKIACLHSQIDIVDRLLALGVDVSKVNNYRDPPILTCRSVDILRRLIYYTNLNAKYSNGETLLSEFISRKRSIDLIQEVLNLGVDINESNNEGVTPLMCAVRSRNHSAVRALIAAGADLHRENSAGEKAIDYAIRSNDNNMIYLLRI